MFDARLQVLLGRACFAVVEIDVTHSYDLLGLN
jgi:hypothetical protein